MNAVSEFEYVVNMMYREQILLMKKQILSMQKNRFDYCQNSNMKNHSYLAFKFGNYDFTKCFYGKTVNNFLNSEQKITYVEKRVNNFFNNPEHKILLCKILEIVYAENSEQFL